MGGLNMRIKPIRINLEIPVEIITRKISPNRQDSIFYAGNNIASVKIGNREYVLTTAPCRTVSGEYNFQLEDNGEVKGLSKAAVSKLTDSKIRRLDQEGLIHNWGWFGINIWEDDKCFDYPTDCYSSYDEALEEFRSFVKKEITKHLEE